MVAPRIRLAQVVATVLNPFSDFHLVVDRYRSPIQFACGRTRPLSEIGRWVETEQASALDLLEIDGVRVCRQCRRSPAWAATFAAGPASTAAVQRALARP